MWGKAFFDVLFEYVPVRTQWAISGVALIGIGTLLLLGLYLGRF